MKHLFIFSSLITCLVFSPTKKISADDFKNPDGAPSIGYNFSRKPLHGEETSINEKSNVIDFRVPAGSRLTFTTSIGRVQQTWNTPGIPTTYSGTCYSFGVRVYLHDPYADK